MKVKKILIMISYYKTNIGKLSLVAGVWNTVISPISCIKMYFYK